MRKPSLKGVWAKLDRGNDHFKALEGEVGALIQSDAYEHRGQLEDERTQYVLRCHISDPPPDLTRIGIVFGDMVHNLRTALDHLLCQLVIASGREPTKQHQFPIFTRDPATDPTGEQLRTWKRWTKGIKQPYLGLLKEVQPYQAAKESERRSLAVLADFSNADKHRIILPAVFAVSEEVRDSFTLIPRDLEVIGQTTVTFRKPLKEGTEILRAPVRVTGPDPHMYVEGHIPLDPAFGEPPTPGRDIAVLRDEIRFVVHVFEQLLDAR